MGSVIPLKNSANSAYLDLKNLVVNKLGKVEDLINIKLKSKVDLIQKMTKNAKTKKNCTHAVVEVSVEGMINKNEDARGCDLQP